MKKWEDLTNDQKADMNILQTSEVSFLIMSAKGEIDLNKMAKEELDNRGLNLEGKWIGFKK